MPSKLTVSATTHCNSLEHMQVVDHFYILHIDQVFQILSSIKVGVVVSKKVWESLEMELIIEPIQYHLLKHRLPKTAFFFFLRG